MSVITGQVVPLLVGYVSKTANYTLTIDDYGIYVPSGTFTITLLDGTPLIAGRSFVIKNNGTGVVTVNTTSSQTMDGFASGIINLVQYSNFTFSWNGSQWVILASYIAGATKNMFPPHIVDASTSGTGETTLYTDTMAANYYNANGSGFYIVIAGVYTTTSTSSATPVLKKLYFGGQVIATLTYTTSEGLVGSQSYKFRIEGTFLRASSSTARFTWFWNDEYPGCEGNPTASFDYIALSGIDFTATNIIKLTGQAPIGTVTAQVEQATYTAPV